MIDRWLEPYLVVVSTACLYFLALTLANRYAFRRLTRPPRKFGSPRLSVAIPARNEERNIRACLDSLLRQDYGNYEILILDDHSADGTAEILREYDERHENVRAVSGKPLPDGWLGKHYACHQLSEAADGEYLVFTDADTVHEPQSLSWAMSNMVYHDADFMSAYTHLRLGSIGEAVVVPGMYLMTSLLMPIWRIPTSSDARQSFAIGHFVISRAEAFRAVGGYASLKGSLVDDISMARNMKRSGFKTLFLDAKEYIHCRMYNGYREAFNGFVKNIYAALDKNLLRLAALFVLIAGVVELPLVNLVYRVSIRADAVMLSAVPVILFLAMWTIVMVDRKLPVWVAALYPFLFLNIMLISLVSVAKTGFGRGATWKGRRVK